MLNAGGFVGFRNRDICDGYAKSEQTLRAAHEENSSILMEGNYEAKYDNLFKFCCSLTYF